MKMRETGNLVPNRSPQVYIPSTRGDFRGVEQTERSNEELLEAVSSALLHDGSRTWPEPNGHVRRIPAGYTYLGQFLAHDLTDNTALCSGNAPISSPRNLRIRPLWLDTLYGPGDAANSPWLLAIDVAGNQLPPGWPKTRFVLDTVGRQPDHPRSLPAQPPARDIGRERRTASTDVQSGYVGVPLIADDRNDDQPMLSQLTALFQIAHNLAMARLEKDSPPASPAQSCANFWTARLGLTFVYRRIVEEDYLERLLNKHVYDHYRKITPGFLDHAEGESVVSRDFADAAFRIGHAMVRQRYRFNSNDAPEESSFLAIQALSRTSGAHSGRLVPLSAPWIVDWSLFFEFEGTEPQFANLIRPKTNRQLDGASARHHCATSNDVQEPGLTCRDLSRGAQTGIRKIPTLLTQVRQRLPELARSSAWLSSNEPGRRAIHKWWTGSDMEGANTQCDWCLTELKENPPPFLYYLIEADAETSGTRVGPLGSIILADTFFRALDYRPMPYSSSDQSLTDAANEVFGSNVPKCMSELILWVDEQLQDKDKKVHAERSGGHVEIPLPLVLRPGSNEHEERGSQ